MYGLLLGALLAGLKLVQYYFFSYRIESEFYTSFIAVFFLAMGLWAGSRWLSALWSSSGATPSELAAKTEEMKSMQERYKVAPIRWGMTLMEIFPVGLIITIINAWLLKKEHQTN